MDVIFTYYIYISSSLLKKTYDLLNNQLNFVNNFLH